MTKQKAIEVRTKMKELNLKHFIYGVKTLSGAVIDECVCCATDEKFETEVKVLLKDKWNAEILAIHANW